jgi:hypothetical protein
MIDLDLQQFRADVPEADPGRMAAARLRLQEAPWAEARQPVRPRSRWRSVTRFALPGLAIPVAVVAALVAASVSTGGSGGRTSENAAAVQFLNRAAAWVEQQPTPALGAHDWVYQKALIPVTRSEVGRPGSTVSMNVQESWWSADGSKARYEGADVPPGLTGVTSAGLEGDDKSPVQYGREIASWPQDPDALLDQVSQGHIDQSSGQDRAFTTLAVALRDVPLIPSSTLATIYRALAKIPGVTIENTQDAAGRSGVAIERAAPQISSAEENSLQVRHDIIFDANTYAYLGERMVATGPIPANVAHDGNILHETARLASGVVNGPYDRP